MSLKSLRQCVDYADGLATVAAAHAVISHPNTAPQEDRAAVRGAIHLSEFLIARLILEPEIDPSVNVIRYGFSRAELVAAARVLSALRHLEASFRLRPDNDKFTSAVLRVYRSHDGFTEGACNEVVKGLETTLYALVSVKRDQEQRRLNPFGFGAQEIARAADVVELLMYGVQTPAEQKAEVLS